MNYITRLSGCLESPAQINAKSTAAASRLRWKERLEQSRQSRQIARLNQKLARAGEFRDDTFAADHAAKESRRSFPQSVLRRAFPSDQMASVDDVTFAGLQAFPMNCAEGRT